MTGVLCAALLAGSAITVGAVPADRVGEDPPPIGYPADNMWAFLSSTPGLQPRATSFGDAVEFADVVVVGRYASVERGGIYGQDATAVATIAVDRVVKGTSNMTTDRELRVEFVLVVGSEEYPQKELSDLQRSIPNAPALLLLHSWASYIDLIGGGLPEWQARDDLDAVYKTIGGDGAIRIVNDRLEPPSHQDGMWPGSMRGAPIEAVLDAVGP